MRGQMGIGVEDGDPGLVPVPHGTGVTGVLGEEHGAARGTGVGHQIRAPLALLQRHVIGMHGEVRLVAPHHEVRALVFHAYIRKLEDHPDHARVDLFALHPVAEDGIDLSGATSVQFPVRFPLVAPHAGTVFKPKILADDLLDHVHDRGVVDEHARRPARHVAVFRRKGFRIVLDQVDLLADVLDFIRSENGRPDQKPRPGRIGSVLRPLGT